MPPGRPRGANGTATRILDVAEQLVQVRGFNGFSYADVAAELDITTASLHYHFASKAELGEALIDRYSRRFSEKLTAIASRRADAMAKLDAYAMLYGGVLQAERMCLCGMLAAEYATLPKPMRSAVINFFDDNESWLEHVIEDGQKDGTIRLAGAPREAARMLISGLEGAMLVARSYDDTGRFMITARRLLAAIAGDGAVRRGGSRDRKRKPSS